MKARRRAVWSERHARRDEVLAVALAIGFVVVMAVVLVLVSRARTAGSVTSATR